MGVAYDLNALSGINAASNGLGVISNNLANSQSVGFKSSRAEFADLFSGPQNSPGNGVRVAAITQDFSQGTISGTGRELDMAIDGEGFFVLEDQTGKYDAVYTRNGSFKLDKDGFLTDQAGNQVQGYLLNEELSSETNTIFDTTLSSIDLDDLNKEPRVTDEMTYDINVDGQTANNIDEATGATVSDNATLQQLADFETNGTYGGFPDFSTNKIIHDTLGGEHRVTTNFYKRDVVTEANSTLDGNGDGANDKYTSWIVQMSVQDFNDATGEWETSGHRYDEVAGAATGDGGILYELRMDTNGNLIDVRTADQTALAGAAAPAANGELDPAVWGTVGTTADMRWIIDQPLTGATDPIGSGLDPTQPQQFSIEVDFASMTQYAGESTIRGVTQNGYKVGDLVGLTTGQDGVIQARYSNGRSVPVAQVALANFSDRNALEKLGGQTYAETFASGTRQLGAPQSIGLGTINAGSLEYSNVDVAGELVNMIQTQRTYQASAQVISTSQQLTQTILQL